jgi:hypothetical protein
MLIPSKKLLKIVWISCLGISATARVMISSCLSVCWLLLHALSFKRTHRQYLYGVRPGERAGHRRTCEKPGFHRCVVEAFVHLGYYTAQIGSLLQTFRDYFPGVIFKGQEYQNPHSWTANMGPIGSPETSVTTTKLRCVLSRDNGGLKGRIVLRSKKCYVRRPLAARPSRCSNPYSIFSSHVLLENDARICPGYLSKFILSEMEVNYNILFTVV